MLPTFDKNKIKTAMRNIGKSKIARAAPMLAVAGLFALSFGTGNAAATTAENSTGIFYGAALYEWIAIAVGAIALVFGMYLKNFYALIFGGIVLLMGLVLAANVV